MRKVIDPKKNYQETRDAIGYVSRKDARQADYDRIGFMSGLEVHQQLKTKEKLFCNCPAGKFQRHDDYDAEIIRHMRPTLSELGEYDGTALMEFKTRKEIVYRIKNETACTYEVDDTPPFKIDREALGIALEIALLSKLNIVGEVHITRKQYLDGSIPTGFQRTAILGVEGEIPLKNKVVRLIQLSIEEDSCREISDIGHVRIYKTDRLGMPLIETVTYPDMVNPDEVMEAANYIRFLNRSTGKVRIGPGAGREDVNVSCKGGTRVEIKGVSHNKWIPELTHVECFRQWSLLSLREKLLAAVPSTDLWHISHIELQFNEFDFSYQPLRAAYKLGHKILAVNLPAFNGMLSHFTQPNHCFSNELKDRLKVIACLERPNLLTTEDFEPVVQEDAWNKVRTLLKSGENDAQVIIWGPAEDMSTALDTIEERCKMAFAGVPNETRKSFENGTTIFERVLPGADRMYPDTDSAPIPLETEYIESLLANLPVDVIDRYNQLVAWGVPSDTYHYIFRNNLVPLIEKCVNDLAVDAKYTGTLFGHWVKWIEGHYQKAPGFTYDKVYEVLQFLKNEGVNFNLAKAMLVHLYEHPNMDLHSVLTIMKFKKRPEDEILAPVGFLKDKYRDIGRSKEEAEMANWVMGQLRSQALGNIDLDKLRNYILTH